MNIKSKLVGAWDFCWNHRGFISSLLMGTMLFETHRQARQTNKLLKSTIRDVDMPDGTRRAAMSIMTPAIADKYDKAATKEKKIIQ